MIVNVDKKGRLDVSQLFYKKDLAKIWYYSYEMLKHGTVKLHFFDITKKEIFPKLRKCRG